MSNSHQSPTDDHKENATLRAYVIELKRENDLLKQAKHAQAKPGDGPQTPGAEGALELESLQHIYATAPIGLCCFDKKLRYVFVNEWLATLNGLSVKKHLGRPISEVIPDVSAGVEAQLRRVIETGKPVVGGTVEAETAAEPGVKKFFEHHYDAVRSADGIIVGVSCVVQDVTERKCAEEALRLIVEGTSWTFGEDFFRSLTRHLALALGVRSAFVSELHQGSEARLRLLAYWEGNDFGENFEYDIKGTPCELVIEKGLAHYSANVQQLFPDDCWLKESGIESYLAVPLLDSEGNRLGHLGVVDDKPMPKNLLAESILRIFAARAGAELLRKRAEEALRLAHEDLENRVQERTEELLTANKSLQESEERFALALEATSEGLWDWNIATGEMFYSPRWCKTLGFDTSEVEPHGRFWDSLVHPEDWPRYTEALKANLKQKKDLFECEVRLRTKSGEYRWILDRGKVVARDEDGKPLRMVGVDVDITERRRAEQALRITQFAVDHNSDAIYWVRPDGRISYVNHAACQASGYSYQELVSMRVPDIDPDFPDDILEAHILEVKEVGSMNIESRHRTKSGRLYPVEILVNYLAYDDQEYLCAYVRDITERKLAEEKLRKSEERSRLILNATHDSVFLIDASNWKLLAVNESGAKNLGKSVNEVVGLKIDDLMSADEARMRKELCEQVILSGECLSFEDERDGIHFDNTIYPVCDNQGKVVQLAVFAQDITERRRAEEAVLESQALFRAVVEGTTDAVAVTDLNGNFLFVNQTGATWLGKTPEELIGQRELDFYSTDAAARIAADDQLIYTEDRSLNTQSFENTFEVNGASRTYIATKTALRDNQGNIIGIIGIAHDITERKRAEQELNEFFKLSLEMLCVAGTDGFFKRINPAFNKILGYSDEQLLSVPFIEFVHPDDIEATLAVLEGLGRGQLTMRFVNRYRCKDGSYRHFDWNAIYEPKSGLIHATARDITERTQAETALRDSEERFRVVFEAAPFGMAIADAGVTPLSYNIALQNMLGYSEEELQSMDVSQFTHPDDVAEGKLLFDELKEGKRDHYQVEKRYIRKDGQILWGNLAFASVRNDQGEVKYLIASVKDITERKLIEDALATSEMRFRTTFESAAIAMALVDENGRFIETNVAFRKMFGYSAQELEGMIFSALTYPVDADRGLELFRELIEGQRDSFHLEKRYYRKDQTLLWGSVNVSAIRNADGSLRHTIAMVEDITARKQAKEALSESEFKHRSLIESANAVPWKVELATGRFTYMGQQVEQLLGYPMSSWVDFDSWSDRIHPEDREQAIKYCMDSTSRGEDHEFEYRAITADGQHVWIREVVSVIMGDEGPKELIGFMFNITERKHAEEQARQLQADLAHMSRLSTLGEMASGLAHELNQPLAVIANYANGCIRRLHSENLSRDELKDMLERISAQARRGGSIIRGLESLVRKGEAKRVSIDINESILEIVDLTEVDAKRHKATTHLELKPNLPAVLADPTQVQQVILNLVQNACEACAQVPVSQRVVTVHTAWAGEDELEITVSDSGPGVASELSDRLFEPFFTTKQKGMGMGLAISRSIVEAHHGKLWTSKNPESGASFHFTLPIAKEDKSHGK